MDTALSRNSIYLRQSHSIIKNLKILEPDEVMKRLQHEIGDVVNFIHYFNTLRKFRMIMSRW